MNHLGLALPGGMIEAGSLADDRPYSAHEVDEVVAAGLGTSCTTGNGLLPRTAILESDLRRF
jgi:hypothetical protein